MDKCLFVNGSGYGVFGGLVVGVKVLTLEAMLACCIAVRIEGEKPPETSVPNPT